MKDLLTPCILQSFLVLTALVLIVFFVLKYKERWQKPRECEHCRKDRNYHTLYISGYFVLILLLLFTYAVVKQDNGKTVFEYFSFASVVVSIILAVLTIVYSYYTNSRSSGQAEKLGDASAEIKDASRKVLDSATDISANSQTLAENIDKILEKLDDVKGAADAAKEAATKTMVNSEKQNLSRNNVGNEVAGEKTDKKNLMTFLGKASTFGRYALLACVYSKKYDKTFTSEQVTDDPGEYMYGFLVGASAAGFVSIEYNQGVISIKSVDKNLEGLIEKYIESRIASIENADEKEARQREFDKVKSFFTDKK